MTVKKIIATILTIITLLMSYFVWETYQFAKTTPYYSRTLQPIENRLTLQNFDKFLKKNNIEVSDLRKNRIKGIIRFFDYMNCQNYPKLKKLIQNTNNFYYTATLFDYEFIGFERFIEYLAISNMKINLGYIVFHAVPISDNINYIINTKLIKKIINNQELNVIRIPIKVVVWLLKGEVIKNGHVEVGFSKSNLKISSVRIFFNQDNNKFPIFEQTYQEIGEHNTRDFICRSLHDKFFNFQGYLLSLFFNQGSDVCPKYATPELQTYFSPFKNICSRQLNNNINVLGENYTSCMEKLSNIPSMVNDNFPKSSRNNTLACRVLHLYGAYLNPEHHCMHINVPSIDHDINHNIIPGPCAPREEQDKGIILEKMK